MIQAFFQTIEGTAFIEWFLISMWGFPTFIALHSVGMAIVVGLSLVLALRYFNLAMSLQLNTYLFLAKVAWYGFFINLITGVALLASKISEYIIDPTFLIKLGLVFSAAVGLRILHLDLLGIKVIPSVSRKKIAVLTVLLWFGAIIAGRWIAYLSRIY